jgi:uncharacterized LabA/DUF88 family protein
VVSIFPRRRREKINYARKKTGREFSKPLRSARNSFSCASDRVCIVCGTLKRSSAKSAAARVLILVDESNVTSSAKAANRKLDWLKLQEFLLNGRELIETVIYAGLPPAMPEWQVERDKKNKFLHWLRSNGFLVMSKDGSPGAESHYKANVDVLMAIDAVDLSVQMAPDVVVLVTGDADFAYLALQLRRRGIRVEVAATILTLGAGLKSSANSVVDLSPLLETFESLA